MLTDRLDKLCELLLIERALCMLDFTDSLKCFVDNITNNVNEFVFIQQSPEFPSDLTTEDQKTLYR